MRVKVICYPTSLVFLHYPTRVTQKREKTHLFKFQVRVNGLGGSVAQWLVCWTQAQRGLVEIAAATLSGNSLRQTVHTHRASVHQAAKLVAALLRVARVTAGLAESNGSLPSGL